MNLFLFMLIENTKVKNVNSQNYISNFKNYPLNKGRIYNKNNTFRPFKRQKQGFKRQLYGFSTKKNSK